MIRENDKLRGDFCKRRVDRHGNILDELELDTRLYEMTIPGVQVPMKKKTAIPEPEKHFSFSTKLMVMAIDLYEEDAPPSFCHFTTFALKKLRQFVDIRKEMAAQSYRFFVKHAYNQFFQHEAFHQSATARTTAREFGSGEFHTSTKLEGYVWIAGEKKMTHVSKDHDADADEELDELPRLQVIVRKQAENKESVSSSKKEETQKGVGSPEREEAQPEVVQADDEEEALPEMAPIQRPEDRHGQFLVRQLSHAQQRQLYEITLSSQNVLSREDLEGREPLQRGDISYLS